MTAKLGSFAVFVTLFCWINLSCGKGPVESPGEAGTQPVPGGLLRIAAQLPESLDPIHSKNYWESEIVLQLFDSLLQFDVHLNVIPALAQDWQVSTDGKTYTFNLRPSVRFHNGRVITAEDFVYSLTRLLDPKSQSDDAQLYARIEGAGDFRAGRSQTVAGLKALNASTLQISLDQPYAPLLRLLAQQPASVVPKEEVERADVPFGKRPTGTGAFRLVEWNSTSTIRLSANPDYYGGRPYLDGIHITAFPALSARETFQLFAADKLDLSFVPIEQVPTAQNRPDWVFINRPILRLMYLGLNLRDPLLKNRDMRRAIAAAVNKTEVLGEDLDFSVTHSLIPFSLPGSNPARYPDPYNLDEARAVVQGQRRGAKRGTDLELWHAQVSEKRDQLLSRLASHLNAAGFKTKLRIVPSMAELLSHIYSGKTQLFLLGEQMDFPDPDALLSRLFHSKSQANPFGYTNPKVDARLLEAQATLDDGSRAKLYAEIEQMILDDHPIVPLCLVKYSFVHHRRLQGLEVTALGFQYLPLRGVWLHTAW